MNNPCHENIKISTNKDVICNTKKVLLAWAMDAGWHGVMEPGWCAQLLQLWVRRTIGEGVDIPNGRNGEPFRFKQEVRIAEYLG